jgi:inhibitor of cysteine peptidase
MVLTEDDDGKVLRLPANEALVIELIENPTTGYRWHLESAEGVTVESSYIPGDPGATPGIAGGGGKRRFTLEIKGAGQVDLRAKLRRAWEGDTSILRRFQVGLLID